MRFTWVSLPLLLATQTATSVAAPEIQGRLSTVITPSETRELVGARDAPPVAILPAGGIGVDLARALKVSLTRRSVTLAVDEGDAAREVSPACVVVRLRAMVRAELEFAPRLERRLVGLFPSYTTTCPPPAGS